MLRNKLNLKTKIVLLCSGLVLLTTLLVQASTWLISNRFYQQELDLDVENAKAVLEQYLNAKEQLLVMASRILSSDFGFKRAVATTDADTIQSVLNNHGARIDADLMLLIDLSGNIITTAGDDVDAKLIEIDFTDFIQDSGQAHYVVLGESLYQLITLPVKAPHTIAYVMMGFQITSDDLQQLKTLTGLELSMYDVNDLVITTLDSRLNLLEFYQQIKNKSSQWFFIKRPHYMTNTVSLSGVGDTSVDVILIHSINPIYQQYDKISWNNAFLALLVAVLAMLFSMAIAKRLTNQLARLTHLAEAFTKGFYQEKITDLNGGVEVNKLTTAFNRMGEEIQKREDEISYQAKHDLLTGLHNTHTFRDKLNETLQTVPSLMLTIIQIENFRELNDRLGEDIANETLKAVATRLGQWSNFAHTLLGRLDGAEFAIALPLANNTNFNQLSEELHLYLERSTHIDNINLRLSPIFGVSVFPNDADNAATLIRRAHIAADKARSQNLDIHFYEHGDDEAYIERLTIIESLEHLVAQNTGKELSMVYQPKITLGDKPVLKLESLIRWNSEKLGFVSPELFIDLAEQSGLIVELTHWVFNSVVTQVSEWSKQGISIEVAVNVSAQDLLHDEFYNFVTNCCNAHDISPQQIIIEITERDIMHDEAGGIDALNALKRSGFQIAIDDYGIGQSSLSKLKDMPVNEIKLDRAFIQYLDTSNKDQLVVKSTIDLAHALGYSVVAEGVENKASMQLLSEMKCDFVQGYFVSRPLAANQIISWYENYVENPNFFDTESA